jgi:1-acyl-sn-glycerol-3-phosphate acyltransferase
MNKQAYRVPLIIRILRWIMRPTFRLVFHALSRVRIYGIENVPPKGRYLIAINHISLFEPPFVLAFWPVAAEGAGAVDIWDRSGQSILVTLYGGIPVHRGEYDRQLIETLLKVLEADKPLLLAPEGGRSHTLGMRRGLPGVAYLADRTKSPVVPVGISGTSDEFLEQALARKRPLIEMHIGKPFTLPPILGRGDDRRIQRQQNVDLIMRRIAALLPPEYHGVYHDESDEFNGDRSEGAENGDK